jgi:inorganic pyrophosphatase
VTIERNEAFWQAIDALVSSSHTVIDRPKGSNHPHFPEIIYPVDYGYLENTTSMDGNGIDVWWGTDPSGMIDAVIVTVDLMKKDSEIKILLSCTPEEKQLILDFNSDHMKGILIKRYAL